VYPSSWTDLGGLAMVLIAVASQWWRMRQPRTA
jgi:hypothetical protein